MVSTLKRVGAPLMLSVLLAGCQAPQRVMTYPKGCWPVRYEPAVSHSSCLVASIVMAANYRLDKRQYSVPQVCRELKALHLDETSIADMNTYLERNGLALLTLSGNPSSKPPTGLQYWLRERRYPVICVINRRGSDERFNHAVVVIGITKNSAEPADTVHYMDPSAQDPVLSCSITDFEVLWARGRNAMMIVIAPPQAAGAAEKED